ncbi:MAG: hypothetical protein KIT84_23645 [Labilithrix sp.]|nr:hypothetical protein [Labilithrix sp.]MCW5814043.1 hypothetical protein [Labilithrix sp.]
MARSLCLASLAFLLVAACDRSASERPTEKTVAERAEAAAAPKPSAGTVSSNDKVTDAAAANEP